MEAQREDQAGDHPSGSDDGPRTEERESAVQARVQQETWSASGEALFVRDAITRSYK